MHFGLPLVILASAVGVSGPSQASAQAPAPALQTTELRAVVTVAARPPDPAKAPYKDCLTQIKVRVLAPAEPLGLAENADALLVLWVFQNRAASPGAEIRVGHEITARVVPYSDVEATYSQTMRVDDTNDFLSPLFWAESFKITGGTPQEFPEEQPEPSPAPSPLAAPSAPQGTGVVDRILRVLAAHGSEPIIDPVTHLYADRTLTLVKPKFWLAPEQKAPRRLFLPVLEAIDDFRSQLRERGVELVMVFPPAVAAIYPDYIANVPWNPEKDGRVDRLFLEFIDEVRKLGVTVVDVFPELYAQRFHKAPGGETVPMYFTMDQHWSPRAAGIAARMTAEMLKRQPWFAAYRSAHPKGFEYTVETVTATPPFSWTQLGIEAKGGESPRLPLADRVVPAAGSPSLAEMYAADGPVFCIGDSFSWVGQDLQASFCDHLTAAMGVPVERAINAAGATGASLQAFARNASFETLKAVVWTVPMIWAASENPVWRRVLLDRDSIVLLYDHPGRAENAGAELKQLEDAVAGFVLNRSYAADFSSMDQPDSARPVAGSLRWPAITLGMRPTFSAAVVTKMGKPAPGEPKPDGVEFILLVDGKRISTTRGLLDRWIPIEVDLAPFAGKTVSIELIVNSLSNTAQDIAYWGEPEIWDARLPADAPPAQP